MTLLGMEPSDAPAVVDAASGSALTFRDLIHSARDLVAPMGRTKRLLLLLCRFRSLLHLPPLRLLLCR